MDLTSTKQVSDNGDEKERKRTKRSRKNKNKFIKFKIYGVNIRGMKSKMNSLNEIAEVLNPSVICLCETHLSSNENEKIEGYTNYNMPNTSEKGGIVIAVRDDMYNFSIENNRSIEKDEQLWISINNTRIKIRIGVIYAPQENKSNNEIIDAIYEKIENEINAAMENDEKLFLFGDFNCRIGDEINNKEMSRAGKKLRNLIKNKDMIFLNEHEKCIGKWTRIEGENKSIIDYAMVLKADSDCINKILIDEEKLYTPYRSDKEKTVYSDHCAMIIEVDWHMAHSKVKQSKIETITRKGLEKFNYLTSGYTLTEIVKHEGDIKERYANWQTKIEEYMKKCKTKIKCKNNTIKSTLYKWMRMKRWLKIWKKTNLQLKLRNPLKMQEKLIDDYIKTEENKINRDRILKTVETINVNGCMNSGAFWEFKKAIDKKKAVERCVIRNKDGEKVEKIDEILKVFKTGYENLLKNLEFEDNIIGRQASEINDLIHESMKMINSHDAKNDTIDSEVTKNAMKKMSNKNSRDVHGWSNKLLKNSGIDVIKSLSLMFNEILKSHQIPNEWNEMEILSIYKGKGDRCSMENRRGLFITSVISKLFEQIRIEKNEHKLNDGISKFQCGGMSGKSPTDHILTLNAIIDYNKYMGRNTYIWFGDAVKCFDLLDLKDCTNELGKLVGPSEAMLIYNLFKSGMACVATPVGKTEHFEIDETVRQGTKYGPKVCTINTSTVNRIGTKTIYFIREIEICALSYVDDIMNASSSTKMTEKAIENCRSMEKMKKFTFNNKPDKSAVLVVNVMKKKNVEFNPKTEVKLGKIIQIKEYEYLGSWYNEKGDHLTHIKKKMEKMNFFISEIKRYGSSYKFGNMAMQVRMKIYETMVFPTIFYGIETWSRTTKNEKEKIEQMQKNIITKMFEMRKTTPYWGILAETGIWPVSERLGYKRIMLLNNIMTSTNNRLIREVLADQIKNPYQDCWIKEIQKDCDEYGITIEEIIKMDKKNLKRKMNGLINDYITKMFELKKHNMTKLRFINEYKLKNYIKVNSIEDVKIIMSIRLNMVEVKDNYKSKYVNNMKCELCNEGIDNTEHIFKCTRIKKIMRKESKNLMVENCENLIEYCKNAQNIRGKMLLTKII